MKKLIALLALFGACSLAAPVIAQDKPAAPAAEAKPAEAKPAEASAGRGSTGSPGRRRGRCACSAPRHAPAPVPNKGDTAWMIVATVLVILMTIPGLALFYGGLVRTKNMLSVLMQVFVTFCLISVLWVFYGYSIAFTEGNAFFGGFSRLFLAGMTADSTAATFSKGVVIPEYIYVVFQLTFAAITPCLIVGAFAERMKFSAVLLFMVLWFTFSYLPIAHMVWYWPGPDAFTDAAAAEKATATAGWLFQKGALDFAGGTVVHINAGIAALVGAYMIGKRIGYNKEAMTPHSLTLTMVGASLLWVGWFGFNVGSNLEATGTAALVFVNTLVATAAAALSWLFFEKMFKGKPSMLGAASGAVAGLVAITPACGFVGPMGAIALGLIAGALCLWGVSGLKTPARRRRFARRVRRARRRRDPRRPGHRRVCRAFAGRRRHLRLRRQQDRPRLFDHGAGDDPGDRRDHHARLVRRGGVHRLQDRRHGHRPARAGRAGARRPGRDLARGDRVSHVSVAGNRSWSGRSTGIRRAERLHRARSSLSG